MRQSKPLYFVVPMPPNLANARLHWRAKDRKRTEFFASCDWLQATKMVPAPPAKPVERATLRVVMHLGAAMDTDNAMARTKWAIDWLTSRRYIVDDRQSVLEWEGFPIQVVKRDGNYRIELTLTPLEAR